MNISDVLGTHLKAADLHGHAVTCTIENCAMETVGQDQKPVVYFRGKKKGLVLNMTNGATLVGLFGDESDDWLGKPITIYPDTTLFQGKRVACLRVREAKVAVGTSQPAPAPRRAPTMDELADATTVDVPEGMDPDDLPF